MKTLIHVASAMFAVSQLSLAATCGVGSLSSYIALGGTGCTIGSDTLSNFAVLGGTTGGTEIAPANVLLSPLGPSVSPGLTTSVDTVSSSGSVNETLFTYRLSGASYNSSSITLSGASETGDGAVSGLENFCAGGTFGSDGLSGCTGNAGSLATVDGALNQDSAMFTPGSLVSVTTDLTIDGGTNGSAAGATFLERFGTTSVSTPEPGSILLLGIGLVFVAGRWFRLGGTGVLSK